MRQSVQKGGGQRWGYRPINDPVQRGKMAHAGFDSPNVSRSCPDPGRRVSSNCSKSGSLAMFAAIRRRAADWSPSGATPRLCRESGRAEVRDLRLKRR